MKRMLPLLFLVSSAHAHQIVGTPMLKGSLKTKVQVNSVDTDCRVKVDKVKNLLDEDVFGNPAYRVKIKVNLDGEDLKKKIKVKMDREFELINLYQAGTNQSEVKDYEYFSTDGARLIIDQEGRLVKMDFPFQNQKITCLF